MSEIKIERLVTRGVLQHEGESFAIENNVWLIGDDKDVLVIDAAHQADLIEQAVGDRNVQGLLLTHGHQDHVNAALETCALLDTQTYLHPADLFLWHEMFETAPDFLLQDGQTFNLCGLEIETLHTPGHTPGSVCFVVKDNGIVFSGDTLFYGGPGATRWHYSSFEQLIESINSRLFVLPAETHVLPGHGESTTVGQEVPRLAEYVARGW